MIKSLPFPFPFDIALWGHVLGGAIALLSFTVPLFSKKGGKLHAKSGWVYSFGMITVAFSAFLITPWRVLFDPERTSGSMSFAFFLFFIAVLSLTALQQGISVFKYKSRGGPVRNFEVLVMPYILFAVSIVTLVYGVQLQKWLFIIFAVLGGRVAFKHLKFWRTPQAHPRDWWFFHLENMFVSCIATVTAFIVTALPRLLPALSFDSVWIWLAPTVIMVPWLIWFNRKYEKQFKLSA